MDDFVVSVEAGHVETCVEVPTFSRIAPVNVHLRILQERFELGKIVLKA